MKKTDRRILILDTTLRDGEQTQGVSFSPAEKANIAKALLRTLRIDRVEVASAHVSEGEREAVVSINRWADEEGVAERVEVLGFVDDRKSVDWIADAGGRVINLLAKGSEKHCLMQLKKTPIQHLNDVKRTIEYAGSKKLKVNIYLEDWSNGYAHSPQYVFDFMEALQGFPIEHFMLPDTLGVMSPDEVFESLSEMKRGFPQSNFDFHPHNDYGLATANVLMAVKAGINCIHCTVNCLGERAGNASLAEVAVAIKDKTEAMLSLDEAHITRVSRMVESFSGKRISDNMPIVGTDVFTQTSGVHAHGDTKGDLYQSRLRPERFERERNYALGKMSGTASIEIHLRKLDFNLSPENRQRVLRRVKELGDKKKVLTSEDIPLIIADVLETGEYNPIELLNCTVTTGYGLESIASICVKYEEKEYRASKGGNGGYDAFMNAMSSILEKLEIEIPKLADYEVRIPRGGLTDALTECVITWQNEEKQFKTRGVDADQVLAAVSATMKMLNMHLLSLSRKERPTHDK